MNFWTLSEDSDDGAPQARPFTLPFLPAPTKTNVEPEKVEEPVTIESTDEKVEAKEEVKMDTAKPAVKGFKRRNQAIYTKDEEDDTA